MLIMSDISQIIKKAREAKGLTQEMIAAKMGITQRQFNKYESGVLPKYKRSVAQEIDKILGTNIEELIYEQNIPREQLLEDEGLDRDQPQAPPKSYLKARRDQKNHSGPFMVPLVPVASQAGYAKKYLDPIFIDQLELYPILPGIDPHGAQWRYFEVKGDSMEDTFKSGQYVLASQVIKEDWRNIENFYVYVIITGDQVMIKRLAKVKGKDYWAAISDNESAYHQFKLPVIEVKELWKYRRHIDWDASPRKKFEIKV